MAAKEEVVVLEVGILLPAVGSKLAFGEDFFSMAALELAAFSSALVTLSARFCEKRKKVKGFGKLKKLKSIYLETVLYNMLTFTKEYSHLQCSLLLPLNTFFSNF